MNRQQALKQLRIMRDWHEDNGSNPEGGDYGAICFAIEAIERSEDLEKLITALEEEHAKLREMQSATDINVGTTDTISRQTAQRLFGKALTYKEQIGKLTWTTSEVKQWIADCIEQLPPAQPEIIHCKDCAKHNKGIGDFKVLPNGKRSLIWKDQACPLVSWRGNAQGHEFDYQYCAYSERRTDG